MLPSWHQHPGNVSNPGLHSGWTKFWLQMELLPRFPHSGGEIPDAVNQLEDFRNSRQ
jgi:hypothetical protein